MRPLNITPKAPDEAHQMLTEQYPALREAVEHAHGTDDPVYAPVPTPHLLGLPFGDPHPLAAMPSMWLPKGFHWGLHIEHRPLESAGPMSQPDRHKFICHTTVSPWMAVDSMHHVLDVKRAAPQLLLGGRAGLTNPVLIQHMPLDIAGRALEHNSGPETNRAAVVQIEVCWGGDAGDLPDWILKALANVIILVDHRYNIPLRTFADFAGEGRAHRCSDAEWEAAYGIGGHEHVTRNVHWDPGALKGDRLVTLVKNLPNGGYNLNH
jgi:hypothetical protein